MGALPKVRPYRYEGIPQTCHWCGERLRAYHYLTGPSGHYGHLGNDYFCTMNCAFFYAIRKAARS